jgi:hypothetical protein
MATVDLSRHATSFRKQYDSLRMKQGGILTDDDFNESERLDQEDERRTRIDVIGPAGTPDGGFLISSPTAAGGVLDFTIGAGTLYLGGLRLEMNVAETYRTQRDWLRVPPIPVPAAARTDLVYMETWQQPVAAVEDRELFEVALGGPDTSYRIRTMRRIAVAAGVAGQDCKAAWTEVLGGWTALGTLNDQNELVPDARLQVTFDPGGVPTDLCSPPVAGGYLGAENQAIRVQLTEPNRLTWGFDNGAPLYRVQVGTNAAGQRRLITMQTEPRDQAHWPLAGQIIELLPWSAVLVNSEKLSELSGFFARVDASYNPDTHQLSIDTAVPAGFGDEWLTRPDAATLGPDQFFFMRVWNRGADLASAPQIAFATGVPVPLTGTGLRITITGTQRRANDFWIIAARPESPNRVVPWDLEVNRAPHGVRRWFMPLGVIQWTLAGGQITGQVIDDCRPPFVPLTRLRTCCTITVGDGVNSFGQFNNIQQAIDHLPAEGGEVCVLPGIYRGPIRIEGRRNIKVHGCGRRTIVRERAGAPAVFTIVNSTRIVLARMAIDAPTSIGVQLLETVRPPTPLETIILTELSFRSTTFAAIFGRRGRDIQITHNQIRLEGANPDAPNGGDAAIFLIADDVLIERNQIVCPTGTRRVTRPLGGIHIGGGSERVQIRRNLIQGGNGNGITLGSIRWIPERDFNGIAANPGAVFDRNDKGPFFIGIIIGEDGCPHVDPDPQEPVDPDVPLVPISDGDLVDIRIIDNEIAQMGTNGIATVQVPLLRGSIVITVRQLLIELNYIHDCMFLQMRPFPPAAVLRIGFGGISLASCERLQARLNRIEHNGTRFADPICGIFIRQGEGILIEANDIVDNGPPPQPALVFSMGTRGGIVIAQVTVPLPDVVNKDNPIVEIGVPAAKIHENLVVAPSGSALWMIAMGPVTVHGNQFTTRGFAVMFGGGGNDALAAALNLLQALSGTVVTIFNLGRSLELPTSTGGLAGTGKAVTNPAFGEGAGRRHLATTGPVLFNDNQVIFETAVREAPALWTSTMIYSLDDVSYSANQTMCNLGTLLIVGVALFGWTVRANANRCTETPGRAILSALTVGIMNSTTDNHGTHCVIAVAFTNRLTPGPNHSLLFAQECAVFQKLLQASLT